MKNIIFTNGKQYDLDKDYIEVIGKSHSSEFTDKTKLVIDNIIMRRMIGNRKTRIIFENSKIALLYWRIYNYIEYGTVIKHGDEKEYKPLRFISFFDFESRMIHDEYLRDLISELDLELDKEAEIMANLSGDDIDKFKRHNRFNTDK